MSSKELLKINGITFHKGTVLKMKKGDFMKAYNNELMWEEIQKLKPKPKKKKKATDEE